MVVAFRRRDVIESSYGMFALLQYVVVFVSKAKNNERLEEDRHTDTLWIPNFS